jgi:hypothetical protein
MNFSHNAFVMSFIRNFTIPVDGVDKEFQRLYELSLPAGSNWDEIFGVLTEAIADIKKMQDDEKAAAAKKEAEEITATEVKAELAN